MPQNRKYYQRKKLGSSQVDLPLKKRQYLRKIITFGEAYKKVNADFRREFGKELPRSTFNTWKQTGQSILEAESAGSSHRVNYKQSELPEENTATSTASKPEKKRTQSQITSFFAKKQ